MLRVHCHACHDPREPLPSAEVVLADLYNEIEMRGLWGAELCLTRKRRTDGYLCAGVPRSERWNGDGSLCRYCRIDWQARRVLGLRRRPGLLARALEAIRRALGMLRQ